MKICSFIPDPESVWPLNVKILSFDEEKIIIFNSYLDRISVIYSFWTWHSDKCVFLLVQQENNQQFWWLNVLQTE